jgi:hypothetical protein
MPDHYVNRHALSEDLLKGIAFGRLGFRDRRFSDSHVSIFTDRFLA